MLKKLLAGVIATVGLSVSSTWGQEAPKAIELPKATAKEGCKCCADEATKAKADAPAKADPKAIKLNVDDMSCANCAKTVVKALTALEGVETAIVDLKAKTATVTPKVAKTPSNKEMWEAVEKAGFKLTKLTTPDAVFEKMPAK